MNIIFLINLIVSLFYINGKSIILSFNRVTIEESLGKKSINDYISYDIYTNLYMGTPPQKVTHFIQPHESIFQFKKQELLYNIKKFDDSITQIEKQIFSFFYPENSSSYNKKEYYSENYRFNIFNKSETIEVKD